MPNLRMNSTIQQQTNNSGSGYCKFLDGTLIQWGSGNIGVETESAVFNINFPIPFSGNPTGFICPAASTSDRNNFFIFACYNEETTKMTAKGWRLGGTIQPANPAYRWQAIGRWK